MASKLSKFFRLPISERLVLAQALLLLPSTAVALRLFGFNRCHSALGSLSPNKPSFPARPREQTLHEALGVARLVSIAAMHGQFRINCLPRSLTLWFLLRRRQIESELRIGARKGGTVLEAHAWVEYMGCALNDSDDVQQRFTPFTDAIKLKVKFN